jgi:hypothetical protein
VGQAILPAAAFQAAFSSYARAFATDQRRLKAGGRIGARIGCRTIHVEWSPASKVSGIRLPTAAVTVFSETQ